MCVRGDWGEGGLGRGGTGARGDWGEGDWGMCLLNFSSCQVIW